ncbi:hypothetical protein BJV77DRAFT_1051449, partial [Russula vinacea]
PTPGLISRLQIFPDPIHITFDLIQKSLASDPIGRDEGKNFKDDPSKEVGGDQDEANDKGENFKGWCRKRGVVKAIMLN